MSGRRLNVTRWRHQGSGEVIEAFEEWRLHQIRDLGSAALLRGLDSMNGIKAPAGTLWVLSMVVRPPADEQWIEVTNGM